MSDYIDRAELKSYVGNIPQDNASIDPIIDMVILTTTEAITGYTGRRFWKDVDGNNDPVLSARFYDVEYGCHELRVDDIADASTATVHVDMGFNGTYTTTWTSGVEFQWRPLNGIKDGIEGWPATSLTLIYANSASFLPYFPRFYGRPQVKVTAQWGWPAVPPTIKNVALLTAADLLAWKDIKFGFVSPTDYGPARARANAKVAELLDGTFCKRIPGIA